MALSVVLSRPSSGSVIVNQNTQFTAAVTNTNASAVSLLSLSISESTESDAQISQPVIFAPNTPVGTSNTVIPSGATAYFNFSVIFNSPGVGPSVSNPGGAAPFNSAITADPFFILQAIGQTSDGSVFSSTLLVPVLSSIAPYQVSQGGAFQFSSGFNLINGLTMGVL